MKFKQRTLRFAAMTMVLWGLAALNAAAATNQIYLDLDHEFSTGVNPASPNTPWVAAELFTVGNNVQFTLTAPNLAASEFVSGFYFNFDNTLLSSGSLTLTLQSMAGAFTLPSVSVRMDSYKADGDGMYDILLGFSTSDGEATKFGSGDSITYSISYSGGAITAGDFAFESKPAGGHGPFFAAAHVQGIENIDGSSGWISANPTEILTGPPIVVPEPSMFSLILLGVGACGLLRRRSNCPAKSTPADGKLTLSQATAVSTRDEDQDIQSEC